MPLSMSHLRFNLTLSCHDWERLSIANGDRALGYAPFPMQASFRPFRLQGKSRTLGALKLAFFLAAHVEAYRQ